MKQKIEKFIMTLLFLAATSLSAAAVAYAVATIVDENPITRFESTPDGFSNGNPNTIKTIFAEVKKADLGESGFQWQATGQIQNTGNKTLQSLDINIQLISQDGKIVGLVPAFTSPAAFSPLAPGQVTTFDGILNGNDQNTNAVAYKLTFQWRGE